MDVSAHFQSDLDEISQDVLNLDIRDDILTFLGTVQLIQEKLDKLVETRKNLDKLEQIFQSGQI